MPEPTFVTLTSQLTQTSIFANMYEKYAPHFVNVNLYTTFYAVTYIYTTISDVKWYTQIRTNIDIYLYISNRLISSRRNSTKAYFLYISGKLTY